MVIGSASVLAVITARGGSKGVPRKNVLPLGGRPLVAWTVEAALESHTIDRVVISSDDAEIIEAAVTAGAEAPFVRPADLARDDTPGVAPVKHALEAVTDVYDYVVLLQPTSPFRSAEDIDGAVRLCAERRVHSVVSVSRARTSPFWTYFVGDDASMEPVMAGGELPGRRQDLPTTYELNGAVYVADSEWLRDRASFVDEATLAYVMPEERSLEIDTHMDFALAIAWANTLDRGDQTADPSAP